MKKKANKIHRRTFIKGLVSSMAATLAGCSQTEPPSYGHILRMGDWLAYK